MSTSLNELTECVQAQEEAESQMQTQGFARIDDDQAFLDVEHLSQAIEETHVCSDDIDFDALGPNEVLQRLFPDLTSEMMTQLLDMFAFDLDQVIQYLYDDGSSSMTRGSAEVQTEEKNEYVAQETPRSQICRHYLAGGCYRKDCWFSHDLETRVCRYWLQGFCAKGSSCSFMHGSALASTNYPRKKCRETPYYSQNYSDFEPHLDKDAFPSLISSKKVRSASFAEREQHSNACKSHSKQVIKGKDAFKLLFGNPAPPSYVSRTFSNSPKATLASSKKEVYQTTKRPVVTTDSLPWVSTGDTLAASYSKHRKEAIEVAEARNKLFQRFVLNYGSLKIFYLNLE
jgi:hypothetical protein